VSGWSVLLVTVLLLAINAFFVGAEFAAMSARRSQLEPLAEEGSKRAAVALEAMHRTGLLLATAQLGITVCSVLLGAVSEAALHHALVPLAERLGISAFAADAVALVLAIAIVVFLHVVYGEMIPKNISIARPERAAVALVPALVMVSRVVAPVINAMDWLSKALVRLFGVEPKDEVASAFTAEEVAHILNESRDEGLVGREHYERLGAALEFSDKDAADVGVPLAGLITFTGAATPLDIERLVAKHGFSRYPVVDELGDLGGYLHLKDVLYADEVERLEPVPAKRVRRMANVRRDDEVESVLQTMQITGSHLARVVADDGTVVGVVFLEDVIEELVGEVSDSSQR
jgi:CBS domain containing-hemolysin-like protein